MPDSRLLGLQDGADVAVDLSSYTAMLREAADGLTAQVGLSFEMKCVRHAVLEYLFVVLRGIRPLHRLSPSGSSSRACRH